MVYILQLFGYTVFQARCIAPVIYMFVVGAILTGVYNR